MPISRAVTIIIAAEARIKLAAIATSTLTATLIWGPIAGVKAELPCRNIITLVDLLSDQFL
jgi:hypothetical protein